MAEFVTIRGLDRIQGDLRWLETEFPGDVDTIVGDFAREESVALGDRAYPPELPNQKYIRTGDLGNGWLAEKESNARWLVVNREDYSPWVVGKKTQVPIHQGRWWIAVDIISDDTPKLVRRLEGRVQERFNQ